MKRLKPTPGPWHWWNASDGRPQPYGLAQLIGGSKTILSLYGGEGEQALGEDGAEIANARLIAAAPAMHLALELISWRLARSERSADFPSLIEFCFDGLRYSMNGDWNALMNVIGWDVARAAIAKATGEKP